MVLAGDEIVACASVSVALPSIGLALGFAIGTATPAFLPASAGPLPSVDRVSFKQQFFGFIPKTALSC